MFVLKTAYLSNKGKYTFFTFRDTTTKFLTSKNLEKYTSIVEWDKGYLVVMSKNYNQDECEDYIDLVPILRNLYMDVDEFLRDIKGVEIKYVWKRIKKIADDAAMIVKGYAFSYKDNNISVLNLNNPSRAILISQDGVILESNTDEIEEALILKIWNEDKEFMEV